MSKKVPITLAILGVVALGLFYFFNDPVADAEVTSEELPLNAPGPESFPRGRVTATATGGEVKTYSIPNSVHEHKSDFNPETSTVLWKRKGEDTIFYSTYDVWTTERAITYASSEGSTTQLTSNYSIEVVTLPSKYKCFFLKDGDSETGSLKYTCSTTTNYGFTYLQLFSPKDFSYKIGDTAIKPTNVRSITSTSSSLIEASIEPVEFYAVFSDKYTPDNKYYLNDVSCHYDTTQFALDCQAGNISHAKVQGLDPGIVVIPKKDENGNTTGEEYYVFYRDVNSDTIFYLKNNNPANPIRMENSKGDKRESSQRIAVRRFGEYVYISWRGTPDQYGEPNDGIRFARVRISDLSDTNMGDKKWEYCSLKYKKGSDEPANSVPSDHAPNLLEFNGHLYILYADNGDEDKLSYFLISGINMSDDECEVGAIQWP